ncbi:ABC transporter permease [Plantactinospora sonchi]|uniref:FtsX-like permease family protein n=1 Tax=Plantactinospora sonchi TaxID=1544735 RepID=A0ABU7S5F0_9ACTN
MTGLALATLRTAWTSVVGAFVAIALGVGMISAIALVLAGTLSAPQREPQRFAAAPVVVRGPAELTVSGDTASNGGADEEDDEGGAQSVRRDEPAPLSPELIARVAAVSPVVEDRTFYAQLAGGPADQVGHPWATAAFAPYQLAAGRPPGTDDEVAVPEGTGTVGQRVRVLTAEGPRDYTVAGVTRPVSFESAVFFTDAEARRLSPAVDALVATGPVNPIESAVGPDAEVLTGVERWAAEPAAAEDRQRLLNTRTLLGVSGGIAAFVAIFVVASTFAFVVAQRRGEFALLRTVGATPAQVRRMVLAEAGAVGLAGSLVGCLLGALAGPVLADRLISDGIAPDWFSASPAPAPLAFSIVVGLGVALVAAWTASRRAGRVAPVEALRQAAVDDRPMTRGRWIWGLALLGCAVGGMLFVARVQPLIATVPVIYLWILILTVTAVALLAPAIVPPFTRLVTLPLGWLPGATGLLARENTLAAVRRTAGTAAPVLLTVGLAVSLLGALGTIDEARTSERDRQLATDLVLLPDGTPGISPVVADRIAAATGVDAATPVPLTVYGFDSGSLRDYDAIAVDPAAMARTVRLDVVDGTFGELSDSTVVLTDDWEIPVGDSVDLWLPDGRRATLRVVGLVATGIGTPDAYLAANHAARGLADEVLVPTDAGGDPAQLRSRIAAIADEFGARVADRSAYVGAGGGGTPQGSTAGIAVMLVVTALYSGIAIVNTMVMAAAGRVREFAVLRLTGATPRQVLRVVAAESLLVVGVGLVLAAAATALNLAGLLTALSTLVGATPARVPWLLAGALLAASTLLVLIGALITVRNTLRGPAVQLVAARE